MRSWIVRILLLPLFFAGLASTGAKVMVDGADCNEQCPCVDTDGTPVGGYRVCPFPG